MSDSYVQVAVDGSGKKMQTYENTISAQTVEAEAVVLVDTAGGNITVRDIEDTPVEADRGILTHAVVYGHTTAGGGAYVEVKVSPSGALQVGFSSVERTCASSVVSASGSVSAGAQSVQFIPSSDFTGTLLGAAWPGTNGAIQFSANAGDTLGAIVYTRSTGSLTILTIT